MMVNARPRMQVRLYRLQTYAYFGLRTNSAGDTAALSGMAQCVDYLMAAAGPLLLGQLHDWTGGWTAPLLITAAISIAGAFTGMLAGRNIQLEPAHR